MALVVPESIEGVALVIWLTIISHVDAPKEMPLAGWMLDVFAECLRAAEGERFSDRRSAH